jgi:hypothetical protein
VLHAHLSHLAAITNLKPYIMKNLTTCLLTLIIFGCTPSNDELQLETGFDNEMSQIDYEEIYDMIQIENAELNATSLEKGVNGKSSNGKGVYFVPIYSDDIFNWVIIWAVPETSLIMFIDFPKDGDDRAIVFSEDEMMANFTIQGPRLALRDTENWPSIKYANYCEENKTGLFKLRARTTYNAVDRDNDGTIDFYHWGPGAPDTELDKNFLMHVKSTLTNACNDPTEIVDFSLTLQLQNGRLRETATID